MKRKKKIILILAAILLAGAGTLAVNLVQAFDYKSTLAVKEPKEPPKQEEKKEEEVDYKEDINAPSNIITVLFLGVDKAKDRTQGVYRSDMIAIAKIDLNTNKIKVLSIPRDTYTYIPVEGKKDKITHAYAYGTIKGNAAQASIDAVEQFLGAGEIIDYYFSMDMDPILYIVDAMGGIEINVDTRMDYPDYDVCLEPGVQMLDGMDAYLYLNWRYTAGGDLDRIKRVQYFMGELFKQLKASGKVKETLLLLIKYKDNFETDFTKKQLVAFAAFANQLPDGSVTYYNLTGGSKTINGISYWIPDPNTEVISEFLL